MAVYLSYGNALITNEEFHEKKSAGDFERFSKAIENGGDATLEFSTGRLTAAALPEPASPWGPSRGAGLPDADPAARSQFSDIGLNKPLSIEIRHVYTGKYPLKSFFERKKDMLVTSAMKSIVSYGAAQKAINYLLKDVSARSNIRVGDASAQGTPLVFYSPALTQTSSIVTMEFVFDSFPREVADKLANGFKMTAGIPVFASASFYLLAAGSLTKIIGQAGNSIFDGDIAFKVTEELSFERPGSRVPVAGYRLLTQDAFDHDVLQRYSLNDDGVLVDASGTAYNGDHPYMVLSLDGKENADYLQFAPTAMSAAVLDKFYNVKEGNETSIELLIESFKLYNDWSFRKKADEFQLQLAGLEKGSERYKALEEKYKASLANIMNPVLKPADNR